MAFSLKMALKGVQEASSVSEHGLRSVVAVLDHLESRTEDIEECLLKFNRLLTSTLSSKTLELIAASAFPQSIVKTIKRHLENPPIVAFACQCIARSATSVEAAGSFVRAGALDEAFAAMDAHKAHGGIQNVALFLLRNVLKDPNAARQAVAGGAITRVLAAMNLATGREIQFGGLVSLRLMMEASRANRYYWQESLKVARASIQEAGLQAKVNHQSDAALCQAADDVLALVIPRFKEVPCWHWQSGWCKMGPKCTYAHGSDDLRTYGKASGKGAYRRECRDPSAAVRQAAIPLLGEARFGDLLKKAGDLYKLPSEQPTILEHCFYQDWRYVPALGVPSRELSLRRCQRRCRSEAGCRFISYWGSGHCVLSGEDAYAIKELYATAGPRNCSQVLASCRERPGPSFPGATRIESAEAWPSGRVPFPLECWPHTAGVLKGCGTAQVLQTLDHGLAANCRNLEEVSVPLYQTCTSLCAKTPLCSIAVEKEKGCFLGKMTSGLDCHKGEDGRILRAARMLQGQVRVLKDLRGLQVQGLIKAFDEMELQGDPRTEGVRACRLACYSSLLCTIWQYYIGKGCWVEEPTTWKVQFPLTSAIAPKGELTIAGEYIQHFCPDVSWTPSKEWTLVASGINCTGAAKDLSGSKAITALDCQRRAAADEDCGTQLTSNDMACFCVLKGHACERQPSGFGFGLYKLQTLTPEATAAGGNLVPGGQLPPRGHVRVQMQLKGVEYDLLSGPQLRELDAELAQDVAQATGLSTDDLWDEAGVPGHVSLDAADGLGVFFNLEIPRHHSPESLTRVFWSESLQESLHNTVYEVAPESITGPVRVSVAFSEAQAPKPRRGSSLWLVLLGFALLLALVCTCLLSYRWLGGKGGRGRCSTLDWELQSCHDGIFDSELPGLRAGALPSVPRAWQAILQAMIEDDQTMPRGRGARGDDRQAETARRSAEAPKRMAGRGNWELISGCQQFSVADAAIGAAAARDASAAVRLGACRQLAKALGAPHGAEALGSSDPILARGAAGAAKAFALCGRAGRLKWLRTLLAELCGGLAPGVPVPDEAEARLLAGGKKRPFSPKPAPEAAAPAAPEALLYGHFVAQQLLALPLSAGIGAGGDHAHHRGDCRKFLELRAAAAASFLEHEGSLNESILATCTISLLIKALLLSLSEEPGLRPAALRHGAQQAVPALQAAAESPEAAKRCLEGEDEKPTRKRRMSRVEEKLKTPESKKKAAASSGRKRRRTADAGAAHS
ncbi:unnamed protein product [Effrenium voratum]|nr:unnamed protein product [Effrenium voratum]